jgi:hypothetical protein
MKHLNQIRMLDAYEDGFHCLHCGVFITADPAVSGVRNRNHCPYCLRSRHLDLFEAGDRLAACKAPMEPVALTFKRSRNKYARRGTGELMLVHQCHGCGKISLNRIAADDVAETLMEVYETSLGLGLDECSRMEREGVRILRASEYGFVTRQLYGTSAHALLGVAA